MLFGKSTPAILAIFYLNFYDYTLTLAHLELGVLLADNVQAALTPDNLAVFAAFLDGGFDFHRYLIFYLYLKEILPLVKS